MRLRRTLVMAGLAAGGTVVAGRAAERRWHAATEDHDPLRLPDGEERKVDTSDGAVLAVTVAGEGPTVVLAHCWTGHRGFWAPVARRLVDAGHRVVLYDQRGHGASTVGDDGITIPRLGTDLREVIETLDVRDAVLAGHSMGGMAAQALLIGHPDAATRVRRVVLVATAGHGLAAQVGGSRAAWLLAHPRLPRVFAGRRGLVLVRRIMGARPQHPHVAATRDGFVDTEAAVRSGCAVAIGAMDHREALAAVTHPVLVVVGSRDTLVPPALSRALAESIPGARLLELPDAGHMLPFEEPDRLASLIAYRQ